jgi:hypothetical protein
MKPCYARLREYFSFISFLSGLAKVLDIGNTSSIYIPLVHISSMHISSKDPDMLDYKAIESDWKAVGKDLQTAIYEFSKQVKDNHVSV